jgi:hypothetical protein
MRHKGIKVFFTFKNMAKKLVGFFCQKQCMQQMFAAKSAEMRNNFCV